VNRRRSSRIARPLIPVSSASSSEETSERQTDNNSFPPSSSSLSSSSSSSSTRKWRVNSLRGGEGGDRGRVATSSRHYDDKNRSVLEKNASFIRAVVAIPGCVKHKPLRYVTTYSQASSKGERRGDGMKMSSSDSKDDDRYEHSYDDDGNKGGSAMATLSDMQMDVSDRDSETVLSAEEQERKLRQTEAKNIVARRLQNARNDRLHLTKPYAVVRLDRVNGVGKDEDRAPYKQVMSRRQMLRDTDLSPRDLRRIDPVLTQSNNTPAIIVREDSILVNLGVRIIIREDHALLLGPETGPSNNFLEAWNQKIAAQKMLKGVANGVPIGGSSVDGGVGFASMQQDNAEGLEIPFELQVVEAALQETVHQLEERLETVTRRYRALERRMQLNINKETLDELRFMKQTLVQLESRAEAVRDVLLDTLNDEDDIARMTLSSTAKKENEEDAETIEYEEEEVENLIEYYLQQAEACHSGAEALLENARDLDESVASTLAARRLEVSKLELTLSIASFSAAIGAVVTGIFGMNLRSCLEMSVSAFYITCGLLLFGLTYCSIALIKWCRRKGVL
jgi:magnesium transporter